MPTRGTDVTPTADRLQITRRRPKTLTHADEHPWPTAYHPQTDKEREAEARRLRRARLTCAQQVLDGKLNRTELRERLDQLGLLP